MPPPWGALPPPAGHEQDPDSGWDLGNPAKDVYVFLPGDGGYRRLVADFIRLTGRVPLPPLAFFGLMDSRYYPYRQDEALEVLDTFRRKGIPLDVFVLDTDWRVGASHGYEINTTLFPDLRAFLDEAHRRNVRVMLNDHPEPVSERSLDARELRYRRDGLTGLLDLGVDFWWFDRNWHVTLRSPAEGLAKEVWGMRVYHDIVRAHRPEARPVILSNVEGVDNGFLNAPSSPAAHRYPIWWTGDTRAAWEYLERGVKNAVNSGVLSLLPYVSEDLAGHHDIPDNELYVRFLQYGALSPVCRLHCSWLLHRFPWMFGRDAEGIVTEYIRLRYRLLPTFYASAREAFEEGVPLVRRCDLYWPEHAEAASDTQYLLGPDLLVAPILEAAVPLTPVPPSCLRTATGAEGLDAAYFANPDLKGEPACRRIEPQVNHGWFGRPPAPGVQNEGFSARWRGTLGPIREGGAYRLGVCTNDGIRLWLDGRLLVDDFDKPGAVCRWADVELETGRRYAIRLEYRNRVKCHTLCELLWGRREREAASRPVWIPPGAWLDAWTGESVAGPARREAAAPLERVPLFLRGGGILFSVPLRRHTGTAVWPEIEARFLAAPGSFSTARELYEDDGWSNGYLAGRCRKTRVVFSGDGSRLDIRIEPSQGPFDAGDARRWTIMVHGLRAEPRRVLVDGVEIRSARWATRHGLLPLDALNGAAPGTAVPVLEIRLESRSVLAAARIEILT